MERIEPIRRLHSLAQMVVRAEKELLALADQKTQPKVKADAYDAFLQIDDTITLRGTLKSHRKKAFGTFCHSKPASQASAHPKTSSPRPFWIWAARSVYSRGDRAIH